MYIPHSIYLFAVDGHLGYYHVLAIVNNAAKNVNVQNICLSPGLYFFLGVYTAVESLAHMTTL